MIFMSEANEYTRIRQRRFRSTDRLPTVLTAQELIDKAFKKASAVRVEDKIKVFRIRKTAAAKINVSAGTICAALENYVSGFPNFEKISKFQYALIDLLVGIERLKRALSSLTWGKKKIKDVADKSILQIKRTRNIGFIDLKRVEAYGRISSLVMQISKDLVFLSDAKAPLKNIPCIENIPTIVVAGYPNVGKSLLVRKISSARPEIAPYPFTTKGILIGHLESKRKKYQVLDTPGLLDREIYKRNKMELQSVLALRYLANVIVFVIDPTMHCGYALEPQLKLLEDIEDAFPVPVMAVENKCDLLKTESERLKISAKSGEGVEKLKNGIIKILAGESSLI